MSGFYDTWDAWAELDKLRRERDTLRLALDKAGDYFAQIHNISSFGTDGVCTLAAKAITEIHAVLTGASEPEVAA